MTTLHTSFNGSDGEPSIPSSNAVPCVQSVDGGDNCCEPSLNSEALAIAKGWSDAAKALAEHVQWDAYAVLLRNKPSLDAIKQDIEQRRERISRRLEP